MMKYTKSIVAVLAAILVALVAATTDNTVTTTEWINVAIAATTAAAVFTAPNVPGARYTKVVLAALGAVLVGLTSVITDGITTNEVLQLLVAAIGATGVYQFKNVDHGVNITNTGSLGYPDDPAARVVA